MAIAESIATLPYDQPMPSRLRLTRSLAVVTALCALTLSGCGDDDTSSTAADDCDYVSSGDSVKNVEAPGVPPKHEGKIQATISTTVGDISLVLDADAAPCTVNSFISLAEQGFYDDTVCHRVEVGFVVQCGDPTATGQGGPGYRYADELTGDEKYPAGTLAMANAGADTNGSQFFIVSGDASHLSTHTVFGAVTEDGLDVIREIDAAKAAGDEELPRIETVTVTS